MTVESTSIIAHLLERRVASKIPRKKKFSATKAVKSLARERVGTPKATRRDPDDKKKKTEKHKPTLSKLLSGSE